MLIPIFMIINSVMHIAVFNFVCMFSHYLWGRYQRAWSFDLSSWMSACCAELLRSFYSDRFWWSTCSDTVLVQVLPSLWSPLDIRRSPLAPCRRQRQWALSHPLLLVAITAAMKAFLFWSMLNRWWRSLLECAGNFSQVYIIAIAHILIETGTPTAGKTVNC